MEKGEMPGIGYLRCDNCGRLWTVERRKRDMVRNYGGCKCGLGRFRLARPKRWELLALWLNLLK